MLFLVLAGTVETVSMKLQMLQFLYRVYIPVFSTTKVTKIDKKEQAL